MLVPLDTVVGRGKPTAPATLGTGVRAHSHVHALCRVRPIREKRVPGRNPAKAATLAEELPATPEADVRAVPTYAGALAGAVIAAAAATHALEPAIHRDWLTPGVHITSAGFNQPARANSTRSPLPTP
ncbi:hypothetical protein GT354_48920 [Streptomyces sp. SID3343]|nr:hypothetical protein [Streptomyces sp. SID3343]